MGGSDGSSLVYGWYLGMMNYLAEYLSQYLVVTEPHCSAQFQYSSFYSRCPPTMQLSCLWTHSAPSAAVTALFRVPHLLKIISCLHTHGLEIACSHWINIYEFLCLADIMLFTPILRGYFAFCLLKRGQLIWTKPKYLCDIKELRIYPLIMADETCSTNALSCHVNRHDENISSQDYFRVVDD